MESLPKFLENCSGAYSAYSLYAYSAYSMRKRVMKTFFVQCRESFTHPVPSSYSQTYEFRHIQYCKVWSCFWRHVFLYCTVKYSCGHSVLSFSLRMPVLKSSVSTCCIGTRFVSSKSDAQTEFVSLPSYSGFSKFPECLYSNRLLWNGWAPLEEKPAW